MSLDPEAGSARLASLRGVYLVFACGGGERRSDRREGGEARSELVISVGQATKA